MARKRNLPHLKRLHPRRLRLKKPHLKQLHPKWLHLAASEMAAPEMVAPEAAAPEAATPETAAPETAVPKTAAPEAASCCTSETAAPSAAPEPAFTASAPATEAASALAAAGKELYNSRCTGCHGLKAEGQNGFPRLAGRSSDEISNKLKAYRAGKQMGPRTVIMAASAKNLTDEDIAALAAYLGSLGKQRSCPGRYPVFRCRVRQDQRRHACGEVEA